MALSAAYTVKSSLFVCLMNNDCGFHIHVTTNVYLFEFFVSLICLRHHYR